MTPLQAYIAMSNFIGKFWEANKAEFDDELPGLLGSMVLMKDRLPFDSALWDPDWTSCLPSSENITPEQGFDTMLCFGKNTSRLAKLKHEI